MRTWTLLRLKMTLFRNGLLRGGRRRMVGRGILSALMLYLTVMLVIGMVHAMALMGAEAASVLVVSAFVGAMLFVAFWSVGTLLNLLYIRSDVELLLAAPTSLRSVLIAKCLDALLAIPLPMLLSIAIATSYGIAFGAGWAYYLAAVVAGLASVLLALLLSMCVTIVMMRYLPQSRAQGLWTLLWALVFGLVWLGWMVLTSGSSHVSSVMQQLATARASRLQALGWTPGGWAAQLCVAWLQGAWGQVALSGAALGAALVAAWGLVQWLFERAFYTGWSRAQTAPARARSGRAIVAAPAAAAPATAASVTVLAWLPASVAAIALKDWRMLLRDMRRLSGLVMPVIMGGVYAYLIARGVPTTGEPRLWLALALLPLTLLFVALALTSPALAQEGEAIALLRVAPLQPVRLLWAKAWAAFVPLALVALVAAGLLWWGVAGAWQGFGVAALFGLWLAFGLALIGVGCAALAPRYQAPAERRASGPLGGYTFLLLALAFDALSLVGWTWLLDMFAPASAIAASLRIPLGGAPWRENATRAWLMPGLLVVGGILLSLCVWATWRYGIHKLARWQVTDLGD